jgi:prepilin-type N-terminal cleavage/methylation domain-containing protein
MRHKQGFTLIELMMVMAIIGILLATAYRTYHTLRQRAVGQEANVIMDQLLEAQIMYYLENDEFFPGPLSTVEIFDDGTTMLNSADEPNLISDIKDALKLEVPTGHSLDFYMAVFDEHVLIVIGGSSFPIFKDGAPLIKVLRKSGEIVSL